MLNKIKEFSGWDDIPKERQHEMKTLMFAYLLGLITALLLVSLVKGSGLF